MENIIELDREAKGEFIRGLMNWDIKKLAIESNKFNEEYIKTGEGRFFAESYLLGQIMLFKTGQSSFFNDYDRFKNNLLKLFEISAPSMLTNYFFNGKIFKMTEPVYDLLEQTKNKIFIRKHPFFVFAIDQKIKTKFEGLNIIYIIFFDVSQNFKDTTGCNYLVIGKDERDETEFWLTGSIIDIDKTTKVNENNFTKQEIIELHKKTREIYANFLDYLNHPYAKQTIYQLSYNNKNRIKRGKFPLQDKIVIDIKPEFLNNVKVDKTSTTKSYKNKFWVRAHFIHFRNRIRYKKLYSMTKKEVEDKGLFFNGEFISKWILQYIKGQGKLKEKIRRAN